MRLLAAVCQEIHNKAISDLHEVWRRIETHGFVEIEASEHGAIGFSCDQLQLDKNGNHLLQTTDLNRKEA